MPFKSAQKCKVFNYKLKKSLLKYITCNIYQKSFDNFLRKTIKLSVLLLFKYTLYHIEVH